MTPHPRTAALLALLAVLLALPVLLVGAPAQALTDRWATWSPISGTSNAYTLRLQQAAPGFPGASVASDSRANVQLPSGASTFLGAGTPPGAKYGSSAGSAYLVLRPRADNATSPSTTTYTFDHPTPDTGWAFVLGDVDADQVQVQARDADGALVPAARVDTWWKGSFNYAGGPDVPTWSAATSTLTGNAGALDTDGASGWFEPDVRLSTLTFTFTRRAGFPVYQTWFVSRARPLTGTVADVSTTGSCPPQSTTVTLVSPYGETLATASPDASGAWSLGEWATQAGWTVRLSAPATCAVVGPAQAPLDNRGNDGSAASRAAFQVRQVVPQPLSGRVVDDDGRPVAGVTVTLTRPNGTTASLTTDPAGRYLFDVNDPGAGYTVTATVPSGYVAGPGGTTRTADVAATPVALSDIVLTGLPAVSGQVTGGGAGLGGVPVTLTPSAGPPLTTVTRGDGTYAFPAVPPGPVTVTITRPAGYAGPDTRTATVAGSDLTGQDFALTRPGALSGTVTDAAGAPVAGVPVVVDGPGGPTTLTTDAAGGYALDGLTPGTWTVRPTPPVGTVVTPAVLTTTVTAAGELRGGLDFTLAAGPSPTATASASPSVGPTATASTSQTPSPTPSPSPSQSEQPTAAPTSSGPDDGGSGVGGGTLPDTGGPPLGLAVLAVGLVVTGAALIARWAASRRPRGSRGSPAR